jgi:hypothetical protein
MVSGELAGTTNGAKLELVWSGRQGLNLQRKRLINFPKVGMGGILRTPKIFTGKNGCQAIRCHIPRSLF